MKIRKKHVIASICLTMIMLCCMVTVVFAASTKTYANSEHPTLITYKGYCQVQGAYKIPTNPGSRLDNYVGKNIKQGAIDYLIDDRSIIGGRKYTSAAATTSDYNIYSVTVNARDSLSPWAPVTQFVPYWTPFK